MKRKIEEPGFYLPEGWSIVSYDKNERMIFHGWSSYTPQTHVFDQDGNVVFEYTEDDSGSIYINKTKEYFVAPFYGDANRHLQIDRCNEVEVLINYINEDFRVCLKRFDLGKPKTVDQADWIDDERLNIKEPDDQLKELLNDDETFRYKMLSRFQSDCECYLAYGNEDVRRLWTHSPEKQIKYMIALYNSFEDDKKPVWCNLNDIRSYKKEMIKE